MKKSTLVPMMSFVFALMVSFAPAAMATYEVLWDTSHGVLSTPFGSYQPDSYYGQLSYDLTKDGVFSVNTTTSGFDSANLAGVDVAVVSVYSSYDDNSPYTPEEINALTAFVNGGGGLLIMGDHTSEPVGNIRLLAAEFGIAFGPFDIDSGGVSIANLSEHEIFEQVSQISMNGASGLVTSGSAVSIGYDDSGKTAIAISDYEGAGRVVAISDSTLWASDGTLLTYYGLPDNQRFAMNTFEYLAVPEPATLVILGMGGLFISSRKRSRQP